MEKVRKFADLGLGLEIWVTKPVIILSRLWRIFDFQTPSILNSCNIGPPLCALADAKNCTGYTAGVTGLGRPGYSACLTDEQIAQQFASRPVTYLFGEADVLPPEF